MGECTIEYDSSMYQNVSFVQKVILTTEAYSRVLLLIPLVLHGMMPGLVFCL